MSFTKFTPFEYLLISIANAFGKDKLLFEDRIAWVLQNGKNLRKLVDQADDKALYVRGVIELERLKSGAKTTQYMMGLDGTASGCQMLAALSGCHKTAEQVGMVDPNKRCDVYTALAGYMNFYLPERKQICLKKGASSDGFTRKDLKQPFMTHFYGSSDAPKRVFGETSVELGAFYSALEEMAPGAQDMMRDFMGALDSRRTFYTWTMPDGFEVRCNVIAAQSKKVEIQELLNGSGNPSTFQHLYKEIGCNEKYVATAANGTHSVDSLVVREMHRRMKHDKKALLKVYSAIQGCKVTNRDNFMSLRWVNEIAQDPNQISKWDDNALGQMAELIESVIDHPSAPLVTIHDEFKSYPHMMNTMRQYYIDIMAEIADSELATQILSSMYGNPDIQYTKHTNNLSEVIRKSAYMIC